MSQQDINVTGGVQVRNDRNELVLWFKSGKGNDRKTMAFCVYRPDLADPRLHTKLAETFESLKAMAKREGIPLFDALEARRELLRMKEELDGTGTNHTRSSATGTHTNKQESVTIDLTDVVTGQKCQLRMGVQWFNDEVLEGGKR